MSSHSAVIYNEGVLADSRPNASGAETQRKQAWSERLPRLLRQAGATAILFAMYNFLSQGWVGSNDLGKYFMLLGSTVAMSAAAMLIGRYIQEGKSPRLLLTLALISVPINFAILGAFIFYGTANFLGVEYPSYVAWQIESLPTALVTSAVACCALAPVIWLGFRTLVRGLSYRMIGYFSLSNVLLLIPLRDPILVAILSLAMAALALTISARTSRERVEAQTREGKFALLVQFVPLAILMGRNLWLYATDDIVLLAALTTAFIALRQISLLIRSSHTVRLMVDACAAISAVLTGVVLTIVLESIIPLALAHLAGVLLAAGMSYEISVRAGASTRPFRILASIIALCGTGFNLLALGAGASAALVLLCGAGVLALAGSVQHRSLVVIGSGMSLAALTKLCLISLHWFDLGAWVALLLVGVAVIALASILETRGERLRLLMRQHRKGVGEWEF